MSETETPYQISIPTSQIHTLLQKLSLARFPDELEDAGWAYGAPLSDIKRLVARWVDGYDWKVHEEKMNEEMPQFTRDIEVEGHGVLNVHYVHKTSEVVDAIPLLFVHGWPGSFLEVRKILPLLIHSSPDHPSFHVVAFSLPGYGFSEAPKKKGFATDQMAEVGHKLMIALGYNEYVTQGGDWGYLITRRISQLYGPKHAKAWHTNNPIATPPHILKHPLQFLTHHLWGYSKEEKEGMERMKWFQEKGSAYADEQSTQPQTLGYSLADSPVGLLAWIYEKLVNWTDSYPWDDDEVLTWISIYWFSRAGPAASVRIYYEADEAKDWDKIHEELPALPTGYSYFPKELDQFPQRWFQSPHLIFESKHSSGGHFAAYENPGELVGDLRKMFGRGGPAHGVVPGKLGYHV